MSKLKRVAMILLKFTCYLSLVLGMYVIIGGMCLSTYNLQMANTHGLVYLPSLAIAMSIICVGSSPLAVVGLWGLMFP